MMQYIKRLIGFLSIFLVLVIAREFLLLYNSINSMHPVAGLVFLILVAGIIVYFVGIPLYRILLLPKSFGPTTDKDKVDELRINRLHEFQKNPYLKKLGVKIPTENNDQQTYEQAIETLKKKNSVIRKKRVRELFYSSALAQNGFIDAILILSASINVVKETFRLFNGRVSNKDLFAIGKHVYYSIAIGGTESVEYATEEIVTKLGRDFGGGIPFVSRLTSSLADGFINATLLTRIALITENYCTTLYINSQKDLYPSRKFVIETAESITSDVWKKIRRNSKKYIGEKSKNLLTENVVYKIITESFNSKSDEDTGLDIEVELAANEEKARIPFYRKVMNRIRRK
ncbi:MAG: hypothetical protein K9N46_05525 [Candidatus Marinimicrobia bacterium]|nr:hypothetical protein [Candidatus Neomarinimicrobiota bacterium]MCF7880183.1 hypothetical protein [Candidatus Neomarinimicrobiota bacterium]